MKHYLNDATGDVFAYETDGSQDALIGPTLRPLTEGELLTRRQQQQEAELACMPCHCSAWQIRKALNAAGKRQQVEGYIASVQASQEEKDGWQFATSYQSDDQFVLKVGLLLGMDASAVRSFILHAATL